MALVLQWITLVLHLYSTGNAQFDQNIFANLTTTIIYIVKRVFKI